MTVPLSAEQRTSRLQMSGSSPQETHKKIRLLNRAGWKYLSAGYAEHNLPAKKNLTSTAPDTVTTQKKASCTRTSQTSSFSLL